MPPATRSAKIAAYGSAHETLIAGLREFPKEMWDFRDEHGCWSIHEHLVHIADSEGALELFRILRQQTYDLIKRVPESTWANTCYHPENGNMTLDDWLDVYAAHIPEHLQYMQENYKAWLASR